MMITIDNDEAVQLLKDREYNFMMNSLRNLKDYIKNLEIFLGSDYYIFRLTHPIMKGADEIDFDTTCSDMFEEIMALKQSKQFLLRLIGKDATIKINEVRE